MKFLRDYWLTLVLSVFVFVLPWQTRLIFGSVDLAGAVSQYGLLSVYAGEVWLFAGLVIGYGTFGLPRLLPHYKKSAVAGLVLFSFSLFGSLLSPSAELSLLASFHLGAALVFFVALLDERAQLRTIICAFVFGLVGPVLLGVWQVFAFGSPASTILGLASRDASRLGDAVIMIGDTRVLRAYGSFPHPNIFGGYLAVGVIAAAWSGLPPFMGGLRGVRCNPPLTKRGLSPAELGRGSRAAVLGLLALGLALTASRSAILGLLLGLALATLVIRMRSVDLARKLVMPIAGIVIGLVLVLTIFAPLFLSQFRGGGELEVRSLAERVEQYQAYPHVMQGVEWVVGNGPGMYVFALEDAYPGKEVWSYQPIHNVPLLVIGEIGIVGFVLLVRWLFKIDKINFARFPNRDAVAAFAMGNVLLVIAFFDHYLWSSWSGLAFVAFVMALTLRMGEDTIKPI